MELVAAVLIAGLAAVWLWTVINMPHGPGVPVRRALQRLPHGRTLVSCPWCLGAWLAFAFYGLLRTGSEPVQVVVGLLAAAGVTGLLAGSTDDDLPTEE